MFVSSTFRDMQPEREILVKQIFPQLRRLCEDRGATWAEVDLRWGVTDEEVAEGRAISICLDEIDRCRPFFIGLLGDRYGWIPPSLPPALERDHPWITRFSDRSVTEVEIRHAALNEPATSRYSRFYLRNSSGGVAPEGAESEEIRLRLARLKQEVRDSGLPLREYRDPAELGELILEDFTRIIENLYPSSSLLDPVDREMERHLAYARRHARGYVGGDRALQRLDRHLKGDSPPLVIVGESGSGKSALLATWAARLLGESLPQDPPAGISRLLRFFRPSPGASISTEMPVLSHFVGVETAVGEWTSLVQSLLQQIRRKLGLELEIPTRAEDLRLALANVLHRVAAQTHLVLVLDGLDQLEEHAEAPGLYWLPRELPPNIRLVLSTMPGRLQEAAAERGWSILKVEPLPVPLRDELIRRALETYRKRLSPAHQAAIRSSSQAANPLFLRILLDELRVFGEHERLGDRIAHYLSAPDPPSLYSLVLERMEGDFDTGRPELVRDVMTLLWAARRGLSEMEIRSFLGSNGNPLPSSHWSPLYLSFEAALTSQAGRLVFHHSQLRRAVESRYLAREDEINAARLRLADCFTMIPGSVRTSEEIPWQLYKAGAWPRLETVLGDLQFFDLTWRTAPLDVQTYWAALQENTSVRLPETYRGVLVSPEDHPTASWAVGHLLERAGFLSQAADLYRRLASGHRRNGDGALLQNALGNLALVLRNLGDLRSALELLQEQERLSQDLGDRAALARCLGLQGVLLVDLGESRSALKLLDQEESLYRELGDYRGRGRSLGNRARAHFALGEIGAALEDARIQEQIARETGDLISLQTALGNQALVLGRQGGDPSRLLALHRKEEEICRLLGDRNGLQASLVPQARLLAAEGDFDRALELLDEQETICRALPSPSGLVDGLLCRAALYLNANQPALALRRAHEAEVLVQAHGLQKQEPEVRRMLELAEHRKRT